MSENEEAPYVSSASSGYSTLRPIKRLLNIEDSVTASDSKIQDRMKQADSYIDNQVNLHALTPIDNPDEELKMLANDLAAATYNYWQTPIKDRSVEGIKSWEKRIQDHILANYGRKNPNLLTGGETFSSTDRTTGFE